MKNFLRIMGVVALGMMAFNATIIDWDAPLGRRQHRRICYWGFGVCFSAFIALDFIAFT